MAITSKARPSLLKHPHPYKSMLAVSSDADFMTLDQFSKVHTFVGNSTPVGGGALDIADSFFIFSAREQKAIDSRFAGLENTGPQLKGLLGATAMRRRLPSDISPNNLLTWFSGLSRNKHQDTAIIEFIRRGWIDSLHTYGDFSSASGRYRFVRNIAKRGAAVLRKINKDGNKIEIWIDHGNSSNVQNFGKQKKYMEGDNPKSDAYHTDITIKAGVKFVWSAGQYDRFGSEELLSPVRLRDNSVVWGFPRYSPNWLFDLLDRQLSHENLQELTETGNRVIVANHFAASSSETGSAVGIPASAARALKLLGEFQARHDILVARTSRLLKFELACRFLDWHYDDDKDVLHLNSIADPVFGSFSPSLSDVRGLSFAGVSPETQLSLGGIMLANLEHFHQDGILKIPWFGSHVE